MRQPAPDALRYLELQTLTRTGWRRGEPCGKLCRDLDWDIRISISGMERDVLPRRSRREEDAGLLRRTFHDDRGQLQLLSDSERQNVVRLGGGNAGSIPLQPQSSAADYSRAETARLS